MTKPRLWADLSPLRASRDFRFIFGSQTVTQLGTQAAEVALLVQAKQLTGSAFAVGALGVVELLPLAIFGLYGGLLADRFDRRALMCWCEAGLGCCAALLTLNAWLPHPAVWPLYTVTALMMALAALQRPSQEASLPRVVGRGQITAAVALIAMSHNLCVLLGSTIGGVLAAGPGPGVVFAVDTVSFAASFCLLAMLRPLPTAAGQAPGGGQVPANGQTLSADGRAVPADGQAGPADVPGPAAGEQAGESGLRGVLAGLRYARKRPDLLGSYLADLVAMTCAYPNALLPFLAAGLHAEWAVGLLFAAPSAGAFSVSAFSGWMGRVRRHGLAIALAAAGWGLAVTALGLAPSLAVALACLVLAGAADMVSGIFRDTLWNQTIPDQLRGRMAGVELLSYGAGPSAGQLRAGAVASLTSPRFSLVSGGLLCLGGVAAVCLALPAFTAYRARPAEAG